MRAAAIRDGPRARNWQSQRVTRRSFVLPPPLARDATVFPPVPPQSGQTAGALPCGDSSIFACPIFEPTIFESAIFEPIIFKRSSPVLSVHPRPACAQAGNLACLCTSCEGRGWAVEGVGKPRRRGWKAARGAPIRVQELRNRLPARIFTVAFRSRRRRIQAVRFPNSASQFFLPGVGW